MSSAVGRVLRGGSQRTPLIVALMTLVALAGCGGSNDESSGDSTRATVADTFGAVGKWADSVVAFAQNMNSCTRHVRRVPGFYSTCTKGKRQSYQQAETTALQNLQPHDVSTACKGTMTRLKALVNQVGAQLATFLKASDASVLPGSSSGELASVMRRTNLVLEQDLRQALRLRDALATCVPK
jgi:hypothetical protein